jgi:glycerol-3-phosphate dehydrogenase (NAD(P)+)
VEQNKQQWQQVTVLGGGSFGTALAQHLARIGLRVRLWVRRAEVAREINTSHRNTNYFADVLHAGITATSKPAVAMEGSDVCIVAVPSVAIRETLLAHKPYIQHGMPLILGTKGIEEQSLWTMAEVAADMLGAEVAKRILVMSGPSFAHEIMANQPTAVVMAGEDEDLTVACSRLFYSPTFRVYTSRDKVGVEIGGALKNVMAIVAGAITGLGLGQNARAAFVTRGLAEMTRFVMAKGGDPLTLLGLSGVGDLLLTCTGSYSRNRAVGEALGRGETVDNACQSVHQVAEGIFTAKAAYTLAKKLKIRAPLTDAVYRMVFAGEAAWSVIDNLLQTLPGVELPSVSWVYGGDAAEPMGKAKDEGGGCGRA